MRAACHRPAESCERACELAGGCGGNMCRGYVCGVWRHSACGYNISLVGRRALHSHSVHSICECVRRGGVFAKRGGRR
eukprot:scaffold7863_cov118-Isochrysis_galbana.AAC.9